MKPLCAMSYLKSNVKKIFPQLICVTLSVYFVYLISVLLYSSVAGTNFCGLNIVKSGIIMKARTKKGIPKNVIDIVKNNKDVGVIVPVVGDIGYFEYNSIFCTSEGTTFNVFQEDMKNTLNLFHMKLINGRLPKGNSSEIIIPLNFAKQNKISIGDYLGKSPKFNTYFDGDYKVVGIIDGPCSVIITSNTKNMNKNDALRHYFIVSLSSDKQSKLSNELKNMGVQNITFYDYTSLKRQLYEANKGINAIKIILNGIIIFVLCISIMHINYVLFSNRKREFCILNLIGYKKAQIYKKILKENVLLNLLAFSLGILGAVVTTIILNTIIWEPKGEYAVVFEPEYVLATFLIPIFVSIVSIILPVKQIRSLENDINM